MAYGTIKVDTITFTDGGIDKSVSVSGLVENPTFTGNVTATGTISGDILRGQTISGVTVTGTTAQFTSGTFVSLTGTTLQGTTATYTTGSFTSLTGTTTSGTTANFVSGVFSTQISGVTVTGITANFTSGNFTNISGGTHTITSGVFAAGTAANPSISFVSDTNTGIYSPGADQVAISTNGTGRLFIDSAGNVGVGTATPNAGITVKRAAVGNLINTDDGTVATFIADTTGSVLTYGTFTNHPVAFKTNNGERLRITSDGKLGLGTSSPQARLHISDLTAGALELLRLQTNLTSPSGNKSITWADATDVVGRISVDYTSPTAKMRFGSLYNNGYQTSDLMTLTPTGLGIGTTAPSSLFHVSGSGTVIQQIQSTGGATELKLIANTQTNASYNNIYSGDGTNWNWAIGGSDGTTNTLTLKTGGAERARIDSSGRLLVGTSSSTGNVYHATTATIQPPLQVRTATNDYNSGVNFLNYSASGFAPVVTLGLSKSNTAGTNAAVAANDELGYLQFVGNDGTNFRTGAWIAAYVDGTPGSADLPSRLVFSTTADGASSPTERLRINNSGAIGLSGANFGTQGQVLVSNGSTTAPTWQSVTPSSVFGWNHTNDSYGLYLPGTSITTGALSGTVDIDVQSRLRRCVINNAGVVQYYLDADNSTLKSGDWLRIVETQALNTAYTGTHSESTNSLLRVGVPAWSAGTFTRGQRVTHNGSLWECVAASTTATPAAGAVASNLTGTDGQVMVEVPAFSVRYGFASGVHTREVRLGCSDSLIAQGFQPHPAFIKTDGTYKDAFYIGAYQVTGTSPATTVSGASNRVSMTRATQRSASSARGTGWHVLAYLELAAIQTLMVTEFRDMNTQRAIGNGSQEGSVFVVNTGLSNTAGNRSQNAYTSGGAVTDYISYRGLENIYGRAWQWVDGFNVYERVVYLSNDQTAFADNTSVGYKFYAQVPTGSASYQKELFALPDVFLPSVVTGASSTTYLGDALWTSTGWRVAYVGGSSSVGARVGAFTLSLDDGSGVAFSGLSARLAYAAN